MRDSRRRRRRPPKRIGPTPKDADLERLIDRVRYVGSVEHKDYPSLAGASRLRRGATPCPRWIRDPEVIRGWLREAIRRGAVAGPWERGFPRYVWYKHGDTVFEGRLMNRGDGSYKGYPLHRDEWPRGIEAHYART